MSIFGGKKNGELPDLVGFLSSQNQRESDSNVNVANDRVYGSDGSVINLNDEPEETK